MPAYVISDIAPIPAEDEAGWKAYLAMAPAAIAKYGGRYLVRGGAVTVMEGDWSPLALVVVEFPDSAAVQRWYTSPEYAKALAVRTPGLQRNLLSVEGAADASAKNLLGPNMVATALE